MPRRASPVGPDGVGVADLNQKCSARLCPLAALLFGRFRFPVSGPASSLRNGKTPPSANLICEAARGSSNATPAQLPEVGGGLFVHQVGANEIV
jgi:hypothetical protein